MTISSNESRKHSKTVFVEQNKIVLATKNNTKADLMTDSQPMKFADMVYKYPVREWDKLHSGNRQKTVHTT